MLSPPVTSTHPSPPGSGHQVFAILEVNHVRRAHITYLRPGGGSTKFICFQRKRVNLADLLQPPTARLIRRVWERKGQAACQIIYGLEFVARTWHGEGETACEIVCGLGFISREREGDGQVARLIYGVNLGDVILTAALSPDRRWVNVLFRAWDGSW